MYIDKTTTTQPKDTARLWRYMDFAKLVSLLESEALYYPAASAFRDPYECQMPTAFADWLQGEVFSGEQIIEYQGNRIHSHDIGDLILGAWKLFRDTSFISCWHLANVESAAMWNQYEQYGNVVAVRTTFGRFKDALVSSLPDVTGGNVSYIDFGRKRNDTRALDWSYLKRLSFSHEKEFRSIIHLSLPERLKLSPDTKGIRVPVVASVLIEEVFISPFAAEWLKELTEQMLDKYGVLCPVHHSPLYDPPTYLSELEPKAKEVVLRMAENASVEKPQNTNG